LPPGEVNAISVKLNEMQLRRARSFGDCWLGCWLWEKLHLSSFWNIRLADARGDVPWAKVLQLLVVNRLIEPGSEFRIHRKWFLRSAMDELLEVDFAVAAKDRLYRCLDKILKHKEALCQHLAERWKTLFDSSFDVLLYDLIPVVPARWDCASRSPSPNMATTGTGEATAGRWSSHWW
jgi:hypothetical protein